jgi:hypothetical protein
MGWLGKVDREGVVVALLLLTVLAIFVLAVTGVIPGDDTGMCMPGPGPANC